VGRTVTPYTHSPQLHAARPVTLHKFGRRFACDAPAARRVAPAGSPADVNQRVHGARSRVGQTALGSPRSAPCRGAFFADSLIEAGEHLYEGPANKVTEHRARSCPVIVSHKRVPSLGEVGGGRLELSTLECQAELSGAPVGAPVWLYRSGCERAPFWAARAPLPKWARDGA